MTGAGGDVVNNFIWKAKPDGYTLVMTALPSYIVRELIKKTGYKILEMSFIYGIAGGTLTLFLFHTTHPSKISVT